MSQRWCRLRDRIPERCDKSHIAAAALGL